MTDYQDSQIKKKQYKLPSSGERTKKKSQRNGMTTDTMSQPLTRQSTHKKKRNTVDSPINTVSPIFQKGIREQYLAHSTDVIYVVNLKNQIVYMSPSGKDCLGYDPEDFGSDPQLLIQIMMPEYILPFQSFWKAYERDGKFPEGSLELGWIHKDGHFLYADHMFNNIYDENGNTTGFVCVARDITDRKKIEKALMESEEKYRLILDHAPMGMVQYDSNGTVLDCNNAILKILGIRRDQLIGFNLLQSLNSERMLAAINDSLSGKTGYYEGSYITTLSGKNLFIKAHFYRIISKDRLFSGGVGIIEDMTSRHMLEEEVHKAQKLESIGLLAGGIAHDYNNILTGILGNLSLAKFKSNPDDKNYKYLLEAEKAALRAKDLTDQLLTFSRGGAPIKQNVDIADFIKESARFALSGANVSCRFHFPEELGFVEADKTQLGQVIQHIVINAVQAMPEGGIIDISANHTSLYPPNTLSLNPGKYVRISIKDYGVGIPEENLKKIFDPFFTTKEKRDGLGLPMVYSIARKHGGTVTVNSEPGKGTEVNIYLPISESNLPQEHHFLRKQRNGTRRVLIMDDEPLILSVLSDMLASMKIESTTATDGTEAIQKYKNALTQEKPYELVIMDLTIPGGMGGKEAVKKLLEIDPHARVIVSSGYSNDPVLAEYQKYGFCAMLPKPYVLPKFKELITNLLNL